MSDRQRAREPPPPDDDRSLRRMCTLCQAVRNWVEPFCAGGNAEFSLPLFPSWTQRTDVDPQLSAGAR